jgi:hypothetical protein
VLLLLVLLLLVLLLWEHCHPAAIGTEPWLPGTINKPS